MHKKPKELKKTRQFTMWVTEGELMQFRKQAHKNNTTMAQYIRNLLFFETINDKYNEVINDTNTNTMK